MMKKFKEEKRIYKNKVGGRKQMLKNAGITFNDDSR